MSFGVSIDTAGAMKLSRTVYEVITRSDIVRVGAWGVRNALKENFQRLEDTRPNKEGWPRQHIYARMMRSVQVPQSNGAGMQVSINDLTVAQRLFGGAIMPVHAKMLTLPATAEAYGHRAREFDDLHFAIRPDPDRGGALRPALVQPEQSGVKFGKLRKDGTRRTIPGKQTGGVFFWLTGRVVQQPDPTILPTEEKLLEAAVKPIDEYIERELK